MEDLGNRVTSEFIRLEGIPYFLNEEIPNSGKFYIVLAYASTEDHRGFLQDGEVLFLNSDIKKVNCPGQFKFYFNLDEHPGKLIEALRNYASGQNKKYVSISYPMQSWGLDNNNSVVTVKPILFVPKNELRTELPLPSQLDSGIDQVLIRSE